MISIQVQLKKNIFPDFSTKHERLYAQLDQLHELLEPDANEEPEQEPEVEEPEVEEPEVEPVKDVQKCPHCSFESDLPRIFKQHTNSFRICSECNEIFCGTRSAQRFKIHQNTHKPKPVHECKVCKKSFKWASLVKKHYKDSACGRQIDY